MQTKHTGAHQALTEEPRKSHSGDLSRKKCARCAGTGGVGRYRLCPECKGTGLCPGLTAREILTALLEEYPTVTAKGCEEAEDAGEDPSISGGDFLQSFSELIDDWNGR